ncbi:hypothetical protein F4680DRAFT_154434 [Xylaria scruposa]|nr:hypothetical protein F4680DRAFT_154434 [Xylaria scruposa]
MCAIVLCRENDHHLSIVRNRVRQTEDRTGHHSFTSRVVAPAADDLIMLSAYMSGCRSTLAALARRLNVLGELMRYITDDLAKLPNNKCPYNPEAALRAFKLDVKSVQRHAIMQRHYLRYFTRRTEIQRDALVHLIGENDILINQDLAKDAHYLAILARKDSESIKALTTVATLFIPPTFVSSLFSIPLFDWNTTDTVTATEPWMKRLLIYLSITAPLMLVTFFILGLMGLWRRLKQRKEIEGSALPTRLTNSHGTEVVCLLAKRKSATLVIGGRISTRVD